MRIDTYENMIDLFADEGKDLILLADGNEMRAKRVSIPVGGVMWDEVDEIAEQ